MIRTSCDGGWPWTGTCFFRGLLPPDEVRAAGQAVLARLRAGGWADDRGIPFNRLPYLPPPAAVH